MAGEEIAATGDGVRIDADLGWHSEAKRLFVLAWPLIIAQLAQNALFATDVVLMGWLGPEFLAAGTLGTAVLNLFLIGCFGLVGVVAPMVAQAIGRGDQASVQRTVRQGFWVSLLLSVIFMPLIWQVRPILLALGQDADASLLAEQFVHHAVWLFVPALLMVVLRSFLAAHGATAAILAITLFGVLINGLMNYALMFGNWGFPRMELRGSGLTTAAVNLAMFLLALLYVLTQRRYKHYKLFQNLWMPDWQRLWEILRVGTPIGLTLLSEVGLFSVAALLMGRLGTDEVAAHAIALQLASMCFMIPLGLSQATTVRVGLAFGAGSREGVRKAGWTALIVTLGLMSLTCVLLATFPMALVSLFLDPSRPENSSALQLATTYVAIAALFQLADGAQVNGAAVLRGLSDTRTPMLLAIVGYWFIGLPIAYYFGFIAGWRGVGIWLGLAAGLGFAAIALNLRFAWRERLGLLRLEKAA